jgi:hypothetical protein
VAWFTRIDRFGDSHLCFSQEQTESCGLACVKMIMFKVNKLRPGHAALVTEKWIENIYKKHDPTAVNVGSEGIDLSAMVGALNELKIGTWQYASPPNQDIPELLIEKLKPDVAGLGAVNSVLRGFPIILGVHWGSGGGHAVLLDTITKFPWANAWWGAVCDPGDGDVHVVRLHKGQQLTYKGQRVKWSFNAWGKPEINYEKNKTIQGVVTEIAYCETPP